MKPKEIKRNPEDKLLFDVRDYLASIGWTALVGSVDRIEQIPGDRSKFELVIKFTGGRAQKAKGDGA
jgi:hypothetical protein